MLSLLYDTWTFWRSIRFNPFRMRVSTLMTYLRDENEPVSERKEYYYKVAPWYIDQFSNEEYDFILRLTHTSDHAKSTSSSYYISNAYTEDEIV